MLAAAGAHVPEREGPVLVVAAHPLGDVSRLPRVAGSGPPPERFEHGDRVAEDRPAQAEQPVAVVSTSHGRSSQALHRHIPPADGGVTAWTMQPEPPISSSSRAAVHAAPGASETRRTTRRP